MDRNHGDESDPLATEMDLSEQSWVSHPVIAHKSFEGPEIEARRSSFFNFALLAGLLTLSALKMAAASPVLRTSFAADVFAAQEVQAVSPAAQAAGEEHILSEEEFREFLQNAKVVRSKQTSKGVTAPTKLTLSDGQQTVEALFQAIDEFKPRMELTSGTQFNFRDSFHFNIAAYELAKLLGLESMIPPTVPYHWQGQSGSLCLWVPAKFDEMERNKRKIQPPDPNAWNKQVNNMWVFSELIYDTDRNQTNMLVGENWKLWAIDFTRAFRSQKNLFEPRHIVGCDRQLLDKLRHLDENQVLQATEHELKGSEVKGLMARRDKIVARLEALISQKGEDHVLY